MRWKQGRQWPRLLHTILYLCTEDRDCKAQRPQQHNEFTVRIGARHARAPPPPRSKISISSYSATAAPKSFSSISISHIFSHFFIFIYFYFWWTARVWMRGMGKMWRTHESASSEVADKKERRRKRKWKGKYVNSCSGWGRQMEERNEKAK